jgi:FkbM family methyltransferase
LSDQDARAFLSYAQNREDYHLSLLLADVAEGFYIDVGGGHAIADNVSFWFYERGWRGIVVEPQAEIARAYGHVRPRDVVVEALCGRTVGEADFFQADRFHGLSTTLPQHAEAAAAAGVSSARLKRPVTTLSALCEAHAPGRIDFLKVDVEGAEAEVLAGNDWTRFRPRVVVLEAVAPWTMADSSADFAPLLAAAGYRDVFFDGLNRFYLREEDAALAARLPAEAAPWDAMRHLGEYGPAHLDPAHPDHALAARLDPDLFPRLNALAPAVLAAALPEGMSPDSEATRAALARIAALFDGGYVVEEA